MNGALPQNLHQLAGSIEESMSSRHRPRGICAAHIAAPLISFVWRAFLF
jgi:hypothetical protein